MNLIEDYVSNPYAGRRSVTMAPRGVVATSQVLAAQAGLAMLQRGGSAVDAAVATAITLTVVEPCRNGIGSDSFAQVWDGQQLFGYNGSGRAAAACTLDAVRAAGHTRMPARGWLSTTVPGAPKTWVDLHERFGRLPFEQLFEPAIYYAEHGYPVSPLVAEGWQQSAEAFAEVADQPAFKPFFETFTLGGRTPRAGETWRSPGHASTLRRIAASRGQDYYEGDLARAIADFARQTGGLLTREDLAAHHGDWVQPIRAQYRGYDVWEIPPNGQGIIALIALNILNGFTDLSQQPRDSVETYHRLIEALKLAYMDGAAYVADPAHAEVPVDWLLSPAYAEQRRKLIGEGAAEPFAGTPPRGGTVYLCAADADGMMVSLIQSNYMDFGSGIVVPNTGVSLQNRGAGFTLDAAHPNSLAPGKRPFHTIIPAFLTHEGEAVGPFGVMGGSMQAQGHVQMMVNTLDYHLQPQASLDAPRWRFDGGRTVSIEDDTPPEVLDGLRARGHDLAVYPSTGNRFGRGQIIWKLPGGGYVAGSEKRGDGHAAGY